MAVFTSYLDLLISGVRIRKTAIIHRSTSLIWEYQGRSREFLNVLSIIYYHPSQIIFSILYLPRTNWCLPNLYNQLAASNPKRSNMISILRRMNEVFKLEMLNSNTLQCIGTTCILHMLFWESLFDEGKNHGEIKATVLCRHQPAFRTGPRTRAPRLRWGTLPSPSTSAQRAPATPPPLSSSPTVPPGTIQLSAPDWSFISSCLHFSFLKHIISIREHL